MSNLVLNGIAQHLFDKRLGPYMENNGTVNIFIRPTEITYCIFTYEFTTVAVWAKEPDLIYSLDLNDPDFFDQLDIILGIAPTCSS